MLSLITFMSVAQATTYYDYTLDVPNASPGAGIVVPLIAVGPRDDTGIIEAQSPQTVQMMNGANPWTPGECVLNANGWITVRVTLDGDNWPSSMPSQVTCSKTLSGETHVLRVTLNQVDFQYNMGVITNLAVGASYNLPLGEGASRWTLLPTSTYGYKRGNTNAFYDAGGSWMGVKCTIDNNAGGYYFLRMGIGFSADADEGFCRVKKCLNSGCTSTTNIDVPVELTGTGR